LPAPPATNSQSYHSASQAEEDAINGYGENGAGPLTFPSRLTQEWRHIMHFQRYEYSRADARSTPTESQAGSLITLPVPENLSASYSADWQQVELGLTGNQLMKAADQVVSNVKSKGGGFDAIKQSLSDFAGNNLVQTGKDVVTALGIDWASRTQLGEVVSRAGGIAVNPFKAVLYQAPDIRSFSFDYKFIVSNLQEANTLREIRKEFKLGMHPSFAEAFADNIFKYPDVWRITIPEDEYLFKFMTCVLTGLDFDFHGEGTKSYMRGDAKIPLSCNIRLSFQEVGILTKEDIQAGY